FLRSAEAYLAVGDWERAEGLLRRALALEIDCLPVLVRMRHLEIGRQSWVGATTAYEFEARALRVTENQVATLMTASLIAERKVGDRGLVGALLRRVLEIDPANLDAFTRLRDAAVAAGDQRAVAELL